MRLLCADFVAAYYFMSSNKKELNTAWRETASYVNDEIDLFEALK